MNFNYFNNVLIDLEPAEEDSIILLEETSEETSKEITEDPDYFFNFDNADTHEYLTFTVEGDDYIPDYESILISNQLLLSIRNLLLLFICFYLLINFHNLLKTVFRKLYK